MSRLGFGDSTSMDSDSSGRTFNVLKCEYAFEDLDEGLPSIPLAAQRAFDNAGFRLTVDGWRSLSAADQKILMLAGAAESVDAQLVGSIVSRATPAPTTCDRLNEPSRYDLPAILVDSLGRAQPIDIDRWASATALDRYVLVRLRIDPEALARAYDEIFPASIPAPKVANRTSVAPAGWENIPKSPSLRRAVASARIQMRAELLSLVIAGKTAYDVLEVARTAGILASKRTAELIPLCSSSQITRADVGFAVDPRASSLVITATVEAFACGSVTSEALVAASTAALTILDVMRVNDRWMTISHVRLEETSGGDGGESKRP